MITTILETKKEEVKRLAGTRPGRRKRAVAPLFFDGPVNIIAELKRRSPSSGFIGEIDEKRVSIYAEYARAISVLTDAAYFGGSFELLEKVGDTTDLPILCKDFFIHERQIDLAYAKGADLILLIARILTSDRMQALYTHARELGMRCLLEIHKRDELDSISVVSPEIVGVNARDLDTLAMDLEAASELLAKVDCPVRIAESGIRSHSDIQRFSCANGFLIGEALMKSNDVEATFLELLHG